MYMQYKTIAVSLIAGLSVLGLASVALAQDVTSGTVSASVPAQQMQVQIGGKGNAVLRGTVDAVGTGTITVKSWGGDWTINVGASATVTPHATTANDLSLVKVGDVVNVQGTVNSGSAWTIDAKHVSDGAGRQAVKQEVKTNKADMHSAEKAGKKENVGKMMGRSNISGKVFEGTASNVGADSFTLTTSAGTVYTVNVSSTTKLSDKGFKTVGGLSLVQANDTVRVAGSLSGTAITALVVRDTSLPR